MNMQQFLPKTNYKVLIVDDAPENVRILSETLKDQYTIMFALNGRDALRLASSHSPDIALLDVFMPEMDGYEVCRRLKADSRTANIPVVFITAQSEAGDETMGLQLGAVDYVTKPFRASLVRLRVANQLEMKAHRDRLGDLVAERTQELELTREVTIDAMATLAEWRDRETGMHIRRTQNYVHILANYLKDKGMFPDFLTDENIRMLYLCAPLHDVGKVSIPDAVLQKPGKLTDEEFEIMKLHTVRGFEALKACEVKLGDHSFLRIAGEIAHCHHERWDGRGYPNRIAGEEIPLPARLMSVADVYDALTSRRVYKPPMPHEQAASIIVEGRAQQFDPNVVDAFVACQEEFQRVAMALRDTVVPE